MNKKITIGVVLLLLLGVCAISGCTSNEDTATSSQYSSSPDDPRATVNYDPDSDITYGTTDDGYGYAYDNEGHYAVSDGENTVGYDENTGETYYM